MRIMKQSVDQLNLHGHFDLYYKVFGEVLTNDEYEDQYADPEDRQVSRSACLYALCRHLMDVMKSEPVDNADDLGKVVEHVKGQVVAAMK